MLHDSGQVAPDRVQVNAVLQAGCERGYDPVRPPAGVCGQRPDSRGPSASARRSSPRRCPRSRQHGRQLRVDAGCCQLIPGTSRSAVQQGYCVRLGSDARRPPLAGLRVYSGAPCRSVAVVAGGMAPAPVVHHCPAEHDYENDQEIQYERHHRLLSEVAQGTLPKRICYVSIDRVNARDLLICGAWT